MPPSFARPASSGRKGTVVVSILSTRSVRPQGDFASYPRPFARDVKVCRESGADLVFAPTPEEMYAGDRSSSSTKAASPPTSAARRAPGISAASARSWQSSSSSSSPTSRSLAKGYQQLAILRRMVRDLNFPIEIVGHPTVREADGLATSSRNAYLMPRSAPSPRASRALSRRLRSARRPPPFSARG